MAVPFALWRFVQLASLEPVLRNAAVGTAWQASVASLVVVPVAAGACLVSLAQHCADIPALLRWKRQASFRSNLFTHWVYLLSLFETKSTDEVELQLAACGSDRRARQANLHASHTSVSIH